MKDKLEDIKLLLKNDRRIWVVAGLVLFCFVFLLFSSKPSRRMIAPSEPQQASSQAPGQVEAYNDLIVAFRQDIDFLKQRSGEQSAALERMNSDLEDYKQRSKGVFETLVDRLEALTGDVNRLEERTQLNKGADATANGQAVQVEEPDALESIGFDQATVPPPPPEPEITKLTIISPGDAVPVKLLTGVNAPVDGTPYPVVFKLNGPITGPDGSSLELGEARIVAAAQGSETDGRVLYRLTDLAIRHPDGRRSIAKVDGWIVGEDGIRGMRGKLIDKLGRLIAATAGVSFAAALGERVDTKAQAITINNSDGAKIDSNDSEAATASALTDASNRLGQILIDRYEKLVPVVEVLSGREVVAVFSSPSEISVYDEEDEGVSSAAMD